MTSVYRLKLADLDEALLKEMKNQYANAAIEVHVNTPREWTEAEDAWFWSIIDLLEGADSAVLAAAVTQLASLPIHSIFLFADMLSEKLYRLDAQVFAEHRGTYRFREGYYFSVDDFLYARCCVIANGQVAYEAVLKDPTQMPQEETFEPLLRLAAEAYLLKTNQRMEYVPVYNIETFSNQEGWSATEEG